MNEIALQIFETDEYHLRAHVDANGEIWFVAADVCACLELGNVSQAVARLRATESNIISNDVGLGGRGTLIVSESGLYRLIFKSRKKEAEKFQDWAFEEVLPAIRKTGRYSIVGDGPLDRPTPMLDIVLARQAELAQQELMAQEELSGVRARLADIHEEMNLIRTEKAPNAIMQDAIGYAKRLADAMDIELPDIDPKNYLSIETVPNRNLRSTLEDLCSRATYLKHGKNPEQHHFAWVTSEIHREYKKRYNRNIIVEAKKRNISVAEMAERDGFLRELVEVANLVVDSYSSK